MLPHSFFKCSFPIIFSVFQDENRGKGFTNGTIFNTRYFHCDPNCGIFCTLARVRRYRGGGQGRRNNPDEASGGASSNTPSPLPTLQQQQQQSRSHPGSPTHQRPHGVYVSNSNGYGYHSNSNNSSAAGILAQHRRAGHFDTPQVEEDEDEDYPLSLNERVVWLGDAGPEFGTVRWVGRLPDTFHHEVTVGVEFVSIRCNC